MFVIKEEKEQNRLVQREKIIIRTSIVGIAANIMLAAMKAIVGIFSRSIAVILDAVNNLSDAVSSVVTVVGTKIANRKPDRKHPLGHGRVEYLSAMIVSALVIYAGITAAVESVKKIISPEKPDYTLVSLILIGVAVAVKILLGIFYNKRGKMVNSGALIASGKDALFDAILSTSVLASAVVFVIWGISLEAYIGLVIAGFIIKSGIEMMIDTLSDIIGKRADPELTGRIKEILNEEPEVRGAYDLILNDYGPDKIYGSVHLELPDTMTVDEVDVLTRKVQTKVHKETGVILTGVGVYSYNTKNDEASNIRNCVQEIVLSHDFALQLHGFYLDTEKKSMRFDVVFSFDIPVQEGLEIINKEITDAFPEYSVFIVPDTDITD